jgi:hypothetical protein
MLRHSFSILAWLLDLFNAPPRDAMSHRQKAGRILFVSGTLVVVCIFAAMAVAVGIFMVERINLVFDRIPEFWNAVTIVFVGVAVNVLCLFLLFLVKKLDRNLMLGPGKAFMGS